MKLPAFNRSSHRRSRPCFVAAIRMNESFFQKLRRVRPADLGHFFLFLLALLPAALYRRKRPHLWLICESRDEARDNGYWFFRYLREKQPQVDAVYAIKPHCAEYARVASLGPVIAYGSFRHWIYYLAAEVNISSQKYGKPNAAVCYVLEVLLGWLRNRRVFLQHGVIKDDLPFLHYEKAAYSLFCCAAQPEYEFVRDHFGYPEGVVQLLGLCRFDHLLHVEATKDLVLIIPTWRMDLQRESSAEHFLQSEYYRHWNALLTDGRLAGLLRAHGKHAVFCLHREMAVFEAFFESPDAVIRVLSWRDADIASLLQRAQLLITDYSSVFMDAAFMERPILYYQFDRADFRLHHLPQGYFDYDRDGFGPVCSTEEALLEALGKTLERGCELEDQYRERIRAFYTLHDDRSCERTYRAIQNMLGHKTV